MPQTLSTNRETRPLPLDRYFHQNGVNSHLLTSQNNQERAVTPFINGSYGFVVLKNH